MKKMELPPVKFATRLFIPLLLLFLIACEKNNLGPADDDATKIKAPEMLLLDDQQFEAQLDKVKLDNQVRLNKRSQELQQLACMSTVRVPQDFATIQEAVDAACPGGDIIVSAGDYFGPTIVWKEGLHLKANGAVVIYGFIVLAPEAVGAKIQQFTIVPPQGYYAIFGSELNGVQIMQNTVPEQTAYLSWGGIRINASNNCTIADNLVEVTYWGIVVVGAPEAPSNNNRILRNIIHRNWYASPIHLQFNCDNNVIDGNVTNDKTGPANAGITLASYPDNACDGNIIKNNTSNNGTTSGFWDWGPGSNNTIGPNNTFKNNGEYGIIFGFTFNPPTGTGNLVFNNTVLDNLLCDIADINDKASNTYKNNNYNCFTAIELP